MHIKVERQQGACHIAVDITSTSQGITALVGPSGAGKSSLINMVAGLLRPDSGHISLHGQCLFDSAQGINLPPEQRRIGYVFQEGRLFPHMSVRANLLYGRHRQPQEATQKSTQRSGQKPGQEPDPTLHAATPTEHALGGAQSRPEQKNCVPSPCALVAPAPVTFDHVVGLLGIEHLLGRKPRTLSGGEKQRVAFGRAVLSNPRLLLMDEPLASLDSTRKQELLPFIQQLNSQFGIPIVYVSHSETEVRTLADRVITLHEGKVV